MQGVDVIFGILVLIMSVVVHEVSHGYAANAMGDPTARYAGRLTLNPARHLEFLGSFVVPALSFLLGGFILGWAKPVPYNPWNLKYPRWGPALVGAAGPASNITLALVFGLLVRLASSGAVTLPASLVAFFLLIAWVNVGLAIFNLIPIPPLDGSKILLAALPYHYRAFGEALERYGFILLLLFIFVFAGFLAPLIASLLSLISGLTL